MRSTAVDPLELQRYIPDLSSRAAAELAASARAAKYKRGETVLAPDAPLAPGLVVEGAVRLTVHAADGREATLRAPGRGSMFGLVSLFDYQRSLITVERSVVALESSTVILLDPGTLLRIATANAGVALHIARSLADSASVLTDTAGQLAFMTVRQRLAGHLLAISAGREQGRRVARATQQELAGSIGTVREVVARTLHDLRDEGLVAVSPGQIEILDEEGLYKIGVGVT